MKEGALANRVGLLRRAAPLLPSTLFDRLRGFCSPTDAATDDEHAFADCLHEAIRTLDSLHHTLTNFLPRYLLDLSPTPGQPHGELLEGSFIFADVTGFTALTGELSRRGSEGREEMNRLMSNLFAAILDPLLASGGDLLIFAGDAALARFPALADGLDARLATRTALRMIRAIAPFARLETPFGVFSLTMSAGVERGRAFAAVVGSRQRMELLVSGGPVQGAMQAESQAEPGQVFAGTGALPFLDPLEFVLEGQIVRDVRGELDDYEAIPPTRRRRRVSALTSRHIPDMLANLEEAIRQVEELRPFLPADIFAQLLRQEDIRQHPPVAVQFINLLGLEELALKRGDPERATAALQRYFVQAQEIIAEREGIISQVDPYARGFTLLSPFGAPTHHEGMPRLAASAALELARALERVNSEFELAPPLTQRTGMTYDRIFTGEIGYRSRREYVVAGPAVNLAARLMSKAEAGQIILDPAAWAAVQEDFHAEPLAPIPLKGIPQPVPRFSLQGVRRGMGHHLTDYPLVGHQRELEWLQARLARAADGYGGTLTLVGEAGSGKSRLASALIETARQRGMAALVGHCRPFAQTAPYTPWIELVSRWFGLDDEMPGEQRRTWLREGLAAFDMLSSLPAFADLLGLPPLDIASRVAAAPISAGCDIFAALQQQAGQHPAPSHSLDTLLETPAHPRSTPSIWETLRQRAVITTVLPALLERQVQRQPTLLLIEDIQWLDADSRRVLATVAESAPRHPLLLLVTARPDTDWAGERIALSPLSDADSRALAALALRATNLDDELAAWLLNRAGGNPLLLLATCRSLGDTGMVMVEPQDAVARWNGPPPPLPPSLQELLLAQVERLGEEARQVMRRGAVIGFSFPTWLLASLCAEMPSERLTTALEQAARRSLIAPPPPEREHTFTSQSLHDAVYTTLSHATRRAWHKQIGDRLADADPATRYERWEQLAYHYTCSGDVQKAARYTRLAGDKARARQAYRSALSFYTQTLALDGGAAIESEQRLAQEGCGDVHALQGNVVAARAAYRAGLRGARPDDRRRLQAKLALLTPFSRATVGLTLEKAQRELLPDHPLWPWLGGARVWVHARHNATPTAVALGRALLSRAGETVATLLREALDLLTRGEPLPPYASFFELFAHSCLSQPPQEEI